MYNKDDFIAHSLYKNLQATNYIPVRASFLYANETGGRLISSKPSFKVSRV